MSSGSLRAMRRKCAVILWVVALSILVIALKDVGTLSDRHEILLLLVWLFGRVVLLCYAGVLLWDAEDEVTSLRNGKTGLERRIRELIEELNKTRVSTSQQTCSCGRIWRFMDQEFNVRDPGAIICKCDQTIHSWRGSRAWSAELVQGLPEDEGQPTLCRYK